RLIGAEHAREIAFLRGCSLACIYGKTKRNNSPSSAVAEGSCTGSGPFQSVHVWGTSRVCGAGTSTHPSAVSSRRNIAKATAAGAVPAEESNFHSNKLAASFSVSDSLGARHKNHPGAPL